MNRHRPFRRHLAGYVAVLLMAGAAPGRAQQEYLPDSTVMVRVADRVVRADEFAETYFTSWPEYRPAGDSLGRVQFLNTFVNKEVMTLVAVKANRPFGFEDRVLMRQWETKVLANVLYKRLVEDSVKVTEAEIEALRKQYALEKRLRHIVFRDDPTAEKVRADLVGKRITWEAAHRRYSIAKNDSGPAGDIGWKRRESLSHQAAKVMFDIGVGQISAPFYGDSGFVSVTTVTATRPVEPSIILTNPRTLRRRLLQDRIPERIELITARLRARAQMTYDSANVAWAASHFQPPPPARNQYGEFQLAGISAPRFASADTSRVLARWKDGQMTLGGFVAEYRQTMPIMRGPAHTVALLRRRIDSYVLQPYKAEMAVELGMDKDPMALKLMQKRREEIMVEHLFQDSIQSKVFVTAAERRKHYQSNLGKYMTYPQVRYVAIQAMNRGRADSLAKALRAGASPESILAADSLRYGQSVGEIRDLRQDEEGTVFHKVLFEEMREGQVSIQLDDHNILWALKSLRYDSGRQLTFEEADHFITESMENQRGEMLLNQFLERHKKGLRIETYPERVMRIDFTAPTREE